MAVKTETAPKKGPVVVSVINLKGGVGKTTVSALLADRAAFSPYNLQVLSVDLDPQANLSQALMRRDYQGFMNDKRPSIVELFNGYVPPSQEQGAPAPLGQVAYKVDYEGRHHLIPSRFDFAHNLLAPFRVDERVLAKFIAKEMGHKDLVLIDCAPTESILTRAAYHASRYILIPVRTEFFSTIGFPLLHASLEEFKAGNKSHEIEVFGVLINHSETVGSSQGPHQSDSEFDIRMKASEYGWPVMGAEMHYSRGYPKMTKERSPNHCGNAPMDFHKITVEFMENMGFPMQK